MDRLVHARVVGGSCMPPDLLEAAGIGVGKDLLASTDGNSFIVIRSLSSGMGSIRDEISAGFGDRGPSSDVSSLRSDRVAEEVALDERLSASSNDPNAAGAALLARLGL